MQGWHLLGKYINIYMDKDMINQVTVKSLQRFFTMTHRRKKPLHDSVHT